MQARGPVPRNPAQAREMVALQIPARAGALRRRGQRLCDGEWDLNTALLLAEDAESLASSCHLLGRGDMAGRLEEFAECLWVLLDPPVFPDDPARKAISNQLETLIEDSGVDPTPGGDRAVANSTLFGYAADDDNGYPLLVRPPALYWRRFTEDAKPAVASSSTPRIDREVIAPTPASPDPPPRPPAALPDLTDVAARATISEAPAVLQVPEIAFTGLADAETTQTPRVARAIACHLGDASALTTDIDLQLRAEGYDLERVRSIDDLKVVLSRTAPSLIVLGSRHQEAIEEIGALVQAARARSKQRALLVALSAEKIDLAARLRAMRAGCDAYIEQPAGADDVMKRVRELKGADQSDPFRIMIIEDDRSQALFAESILRKNGMQALAVGEASLVLDKLDEFAPDLILMDLNMPVCNGIELTALIREREAYVSTPIVFLSGEGDTEKHFEALSVGGDDFLSKPIAPRHLIAAVTSRVTRARKLDRRQREPLQREAIKGLNDSAHLSRRLAEMLSMEDAATRLGGLVFLDLEATEHLAQRLGKSEFRKLLERLTQVLATQIGGNDMLARCGDHGFLLLNPDRASGALEQHVIALRERIAQEEFGTASAPLRLRIVAGICPFAIAAGDAKAMIDAAERAMFEARDGASAGVVVCVAETDANGSPGIIEAIREGLANSSFRVVFQPIVSLHGEEEKQFQALLRLPSEGGRIFAASEIVPAAEQAGFIVEIDRWMVESCLGTIAGHLRDGHNLRLFVSQSLDSVRAHDRLEWMRGALESHRVPAAQISLELRLADAAASLSDFVAYCLGMKQLGIGLTLSGFEAGKLGSEMLRHLPVDFVKLSTRYIAASDGELRQELRDLVKLAHASDRRVIAPRVEEARVAAALWASGIDLIQGNFVQQATREASFDFHLGGS